MTRRTLVWRAESTGGEVANALVCKTSIRGFNSRPVLQKMIPVCRGSGLKLLIERFWPSANG